MFRPRSHSSKETLANPKSATFPTFGSLFTLRKSNKKKSQNLRNVVSISRSQTLADSIRSSEIPRSFDSSPVPGCSSITTLTSDDSIDFNLSGKEYLLRTASVQTSATTCSATEIPSIRKIVSMPSPQVRQIESPPAAAPGPELAESDKTRKCLEAFSEALKEHRSSQFTTPVSSPLIQGGTTTEGFAANKTRKRPVRSHNTLSRQVTGNGPRWHQEKEHYSTRSLPQKPVTVRDESFANKKRLTRRELSITMERVSSDTGPAVVRRSSCPGIEMKPREMQQDTA